MEPDEQDVKHKDVQQRVVEKKTHGVSENAAFQTSF